MSRLSCYTTPLYFNFLLLPTQVKILPVVGADPETNRNDLVRKEEEKLRAALRRENKLRRMRERQAMSRSSFGSDRRRGYADEEDEDEEDDGNTTSLNALKRNAKASLNASRKGQISLKFINQIYPC